MPRVPAVSLDGIAASAASSAAKLMLLPVDKRAMEVSMALLTLEAAAAACKAAVLVANLIAAAGGDATAQDVRH